MRWSQGQPGSQREGNALQRPLEGILGTQVWLWDGQISYLATGGSPGSRHDRLGLPGEHLLGASPFGWLTSGW